MSTTEAFKDEALALQAQIYEEMKKQNALRERDIKAIEESTKADLKKADASRLEAQQYHKLRQTEQRRTKAIVILIQQVNSMLEKLTEFLDKTVPEQTELQLEALQYLNNLFEINKLVVPIVMKGERTDEEIERLMHLAKTASSHEINVGGTSVGGTHYDAIHSEKDVNINAIEAGGDASIKK